MCLVIQSILRDTCPHYSGSPEPSLVLVPWIPCNHHTYLHQCRYKYNKPRFIVFSKTKSRGPTHWPLELEHLYDHAFFMHASCISCTRSMQPGLLGYRCGGYMCNTSSTTRPCHVTLVRSRVTTRDKVGTVQSGCHGILACRRELSLLCQLQCTT